jgi:hypothetical protein
MLASIYECEQQMAAVSGSGMHLAKRMYTVPPPLPRAVTGYTHDRNWMYVFNECGGLQVTKCSRNIRNRGSMDVQTEHVRACTFVEKLVPCF